MSSSAPTVSALGGTSQTTINVAIGFFIAGLYAFIIYMFIKKPPTLSEVLKATDFGSAKECSDIFTNLVTSAQSCTNYATQAYCQACKQNPVPASLQSACASPALQGLCSAS